MLHVGVVEVKHLLRDGKPEFSGNLKQIISYIQEAYSDDYWVQQTDKNLIKDYDKLVFITQNLGLTITESRR